MMRLCLSVRWSVGPSVRQHESKMGKRAYAPLPTRPQVVAVNPALFASILVFTEKRWVTYFAHDVTLHPISLLGFFRRMLLLFCLFASLCFFSYCVRCFVASFRLGRFVSDCICNPLPWATSKQLIHCCTLHSGVSNTTND